MLFGHRTCDVHQSHLAKKMSNTWRASGTVGSGTICRWIGKDQLCDTKTVEELSNSYLERRNIIRLLGSFVFLFFESAIMKSVTDISGDLLVRLYKTYQAKYQNHFVVASSNDQESKIVDSSVFAKWLKVMFCFCLFSLGSGTMNKYWLLEFVWICCWCFAIVFEANPRTSKPMKLLVGGHAVHLPKLWDLEVLKLDSNLNHQIKLLAICCPIKNLLFFNANCLPCSGLS